MGLYEKMSPTAKLEGSDLYCETKWNAYLNRQPDRWTDLWHDLWMSHLKFPMTATYLKCTGLVFKSYFHISIEGSSHQGCKFKISFKLVKPLYVVSKFVYCSCLYNYYVSFIMVTTSRHFFINIFQMQYFWAVKLYICYEKNVSFLVIPKSPKDRKKLKRSDLAPLNFTILNYFPFQKMTFKLFCILTGWYWWGNWIRQLLFNFFVCTTQLFYTSLIPRQWLWLPA